MNLEDHWSLFDDFAALPDGVAERTTWRAPVERSTEIAERAEQGYLDQRETNAI